MTQTIDAIFSHGVLRPVSPVEGLAENDRVSITLHTIARSHPLEGWTGGISDEDAAMMRDSIETEFEKIESDDWK